MLVLAKDFSLSKPQLDLLNKGLTFIPTININKHQKRQLETDIQNYHRKIKLASYFKESQHKKLLPYMAPSVWTPPPDKGKGSVVVILGRAQHVMEAHRQLDNTT